MATQWEIDDYRHRTYLHRNRYEFSAQELFDALREEWGPSPHCEATTALTVERALNKLRAGKVAAS